MFFKIQNPKFIKYIINIYFMDYNKKSLELHEENKGKIEVVSKVKLENKDDLSIAYTPGVAEPCREIHKNIKNIYKYTIKQNTIAVVTDGSAVLGLGNIGPEASIPVMEGKALLFKEFANIDAFPIALNTQDPDEIIKTIKLISPVFGGINLEDIAAPRCFYIEEKLQNIGIPVFHDDQHGTAIVVLAALINASKVVGKPIESMKIVVNGAGAAGTAITKILIKKNPKDILVCDKEGIITKDNSTGIKNKIAQITNKNNISGSLKNALKDADVLIGVSVGNIVTKEMIKEMNKPIVFAMANPTPEIMPEDAKEAGAEIIGTGRSDYPNQINNVLAFPGIFRGALDAKATKINDEMKLAAAVALANYIKPTKDKILPSPLDKNIAKIVAEAVKEAAIKTKVIRD
jgi:malate dehydrogenase (oxaloacetate-decarboxylating)